MSTLNRPQVATQPGQLATQPGMESLVAEVARLQQQVAALGPSEARTQPDATQVPRLPEIESELLQPLLQAALVYLKQRESSDRNRRLKTRVAAGARTFRRLGTGFFALAGFTSVAFLTGIVAGQLTLISGAILVLSALFLALAGELANARADTLTPGGPDA